MEQINRKINCSENGNGHAMIPTLLETKNKDKSTKTDTAIYNFWTVFKKEIKYDM